MMKIIGISGSLRKGSYNTALLRAAEQILPAGVEMEIFTCDGIPLYNSDVDVAEKPPAVKRLRDAISNCDGVLFATPEYNHSIPGVLKNTIDWISRPGFKSPMAGKPSAVISASKGFLGGARAQENLKLVLDSLLSPLYPSTECLVGSAQEKFDTHGTLIDERVQERVQKYVEGFLGWIKN
ncbi:NADPH-dependent FMN reductase [Desulfocicer niacini]